MKKIIVVNFFVLASIMTCLGQSEVEKLSKTYKVKNEKECQKKGGYWYQNKCWANFLQFDEGISISEIDSEVKRQLKEIEKYGMEINGKKYIINSFFPEIDENSGEIAIITVFTEKGKAKTLLQVGEWKKGKTKSISLQVMLFNCNLMEGEVEDEKLMSLLIANGTSEVNYNEETEEFVTKGSMSIEDKDKKMTFEIKAGESLIGMGDTRLEIKGNEAYLNGTLGTKSYKQFKNLIMNHPEVKTIVLQNVPGSVNDAVNMHTGRIIREAGLTTKVLVDSKIASGGVDLFCAGKERIIIKGAQLGIHSWGGNGITADQLSKDHPAHQYQLEYFTMCLGKGKGPGFYFCTLSAAPMDNIHWMSNEEIERWEIATRFIK